MNDGRLLFAHYALAPNRLGYCGGPEDTELFAYCEAGEADPGLSQLIRQFQAAYPYLRFIAHANGIADPTDRRVVEAYWIGNSLLERVDMRDFYQYILDQFGPRVPAKAMQYLAAKAPAGAHPHHSFHVLDVSMRTGALREQIEDLDKCRISPAEVVRVEGEEVVLRRRSLVLHDGKLALGEPEESRAAHSVGGRTYHQALAPGGVVTVHWDWVCDTIDAHQAASLTAQTQHHIAIANQTL